MLAALAAPIAKKVAAVKVAAVEPVGAEVAAADKVPVVSIPLFQNAASANSKRKLRVTGCMSSRKHTVRRQRHSCSGSVSNERKHRAVRRCSAEHLRAAAGRKCHIRRVVAARRSISSIKIIELGGGTVRSIQEWSLGLNGISGEWSQTR